MSLLSSHVLFFSQEDRVALDRFDSYMGSVVYLPVSKLIVASIAHTRGGGGMLLRLDAYVLPQLVAADAFARCAKTDLFLDMHSEQPVVSLTLKCLRLDGGGTEGWMMVGPCVHMRVSSHLIVRAQRRWRRTRRERWLTLCMQRERRLALCMGAHARLGRTSWLGRLDPDLLGTVLRRLCET